MQLLLAWLQLLQPSLVTGDCDTSLSNSASFLLDAQIWRKSSKGKREQQPGQQHYDEIFSLVEHEQ